MVRWRVQPMSELVPADDWRSHGHTSNDPLSDFLAFLGTAYHLQGMLLHRSKQTHSELHVSLTQVGCKDIPNIDFSHIDNLIQKSHFVSPMAWLSMCLLMST